MNTGLSYSSKIMEKRRYTHICKKTVESGVVKVPYVLTYNEGTCGNTRVLLLIIILSVLRITTPPLITRNINIDNGQTLTQITFKSTKEGLLEETMMSPNEYYHGNGS